MIELLLIILIAVMIAFMVAIIELDVTVYKLSKKAETAVKENKEKRIHTPMSKIDFDNPLKGRQYNYEKFKNKDGLYEPVRTKNGIEIKPRKEE